MGAQDEFYTNIHRDAIAYLQEKMVDRVIAGQYVGVISGMLRRSQEVTFGRWESVLKPDYQIAPYAGYVAAWAEGKYGKDYYRITLDLFGKETMNRITGEHARMIRTLNQNRKYIYQNPFPG